MMGKLVAGAGLFLTSRAGLALVVAAALFGWHVHDKARAVDAARTGYVREVRLAAAEAELAQSRQLVAATEAANAALRQQMADAERAAQRFAVELEAFQNETAINPDGVVDADLLRRMRAN